ncbi:MAG: Wzz/FepE/Etk N-terminal domain-containing protein [Candidatus Acidiferrum sp.]
MEQGTEMGNGIREVKRHEPRQLRTLREVLMPLFRQKRLVILTFSATFALSVFVAWVFAARYYVSEMQIVLEQRRTDPAITAAQNAAVMNNKIITPDQISSEIALMKGEDILRSVAQDCGLANKWSASELLLPSDPQRIKAARIQKAAQSLDKGIKADAEKVSDVIDVRYGAIGDPETPACVLQNLGKLYVEKHLELKRPGGSSTFFAEETARYKQELSDVDQKLADFARTEGVADPDALRTDLAQQLSTSITALHQAQEQVAADEQRIITVQAKLQTTPERVVTQQSSNAANLLMQQLQADLLSAQLKRTQLLVKYNPSFPLVQEADDEIAKTQKAIQNAKQMNYANQTTDRDPTYELLQQDLAKTQLDLASQKANTVAIQKSIQSVRAQMGDLDAKAVKQAALIREDKADEANYLLYETKREQEYTSDALDKRKIADVAIAVPAVPSALPAFNPFQVTFGGFLLAILAGVAAGFIAEWLDPSFRTPAEVAEILKMPVLASVPRQAA